MVISVFCRDSVDRCLLMDELLLFRGMVAAWAVVGVVDVSIAKGCDGCDAIVRRQCLARPDLDACEAGL